MDVEYAHIAQSSVVVETTTDVAPFHGPGGVMTPATTRTHTRFNLVEQGAAMTVRLSRYFTPLYLMQLST